MAELKNTAKAIFGPQWVVVTVGNNRTIEHVGNGQHDCRLHGHMVARVTIEGLDGSVARVELNDCGYLTRTTASAMSDFCKAFGISLGVSIAKGQLSFRFKNLAGHWVERDGVTGENNGPYVMGRYV